MTIRAKTIEKSRLAGFISRWRADLLIVGIGFLYQIIFRLFTYRLAFDDLIEIACGLSCARGGRLGTLVASSSDLSVAQYWLMGWWPPGYSVLIAALVTVLRNSYLAAVAAELIGLALLGSAVAFLLHRLGPSLSWNGRLLLGCAFGWWGPPILAWNTNVWALGMFLWSVGLVCSMRDGSQPRWSGGIAGVLLALTVSLRWAYAPLSLAAVAAASVGLWRSRGRWTAGAFILGGWFLGIAPLLLWKFGYTENSALGRTSFHGHLYFESLAKFHGFAVDALFGRRFSEHFPSSSYAYHHSLAPVSLGLRHLLSLIVLVGSVIGARWMIRRAPTPQSRDIVVRFFWIGLVVTVVNLAFLTCLTLINEPEHLFGGWTYVCEPRYYSVSLPFILVGAAAFVTTPFERSMLSAFRAVIALLFAFSAVLWLVDLPKEIGAVRRGLVGRTLDRYLDDRGLLFDVFRGLAAARPTVFVEVAGSEFNYPRQAEATIFGIPTSFIHPDETLNTSSERQVIMMDLLPRTRESRTSFDRLCRRYAGVPFDYEAEHFCRATLTPSSKPPSPPHG